MINVLSFQFLFITLSLKDMFSLQLKSTTNIKQSKVSGSSFHYIRQSVGCDIIPCDLSATIDFLASNDCVCNYVEQMKGFIFTIPRPNSLLLFLFSKRNLFVPKLELAE